MQDAAQQKKPKGKRAPAGNSPCFWGLLGRALEHKPHSRATESSAKTPSAAVANPQVRVHGGAGDQQRLSGHAVQSAETLVPAGDQLVKSGDRTQDRDGASPHADDADASLGDQQIPSASSAGFGLLPPGSTITLKFLQCCCAHPSNPEPISPGFVKVQRRHTFAAGSCVSSCRCMCSTGLTLCKHCIVSLSC